MGGGRALLRYMKCEIRIRPSSADGGRELDVEGGAQDWAAVIYLKSWMPQNFSLASVFFL